jgi:hypothetical protein
LCNHFPPSWVATSSPLASRVRDWARIKGEHQFYLDCLTLALDISTWLDGDRSTGILNHPNNPENFDQRNRLKLP